MSLEWYRIVCVYDWVLRDAWGRVLRTYLKSGTSETSSKTTHVAFIALLYFLMHSEMQT